MYFVFYIEIFIILRFPFEWRDPIGYLIALLIEYIDAYYISRIGACNLVFIFGSCWFISVLTKDVELELSATNEHFKLSRNEIRLNQEIYQFIGLYETGKQLS